MSSIDLASKTSIPFPDSTTSITFRLSSTFPSLAAGTVSIWKLSPNGGHTVLEAPYGLDTDPQTPAGNSKSWVVDPANKYLVWFTGGANILQPGGAISLTASIEDQSGMQVASLSNAKSPKSSASTVNISFYLG